MNSHTDGREADPQPIALCQETPCEETAHAQSPHVTGTSEPIDGAGRAPAARRRPAGKVAVIVLALVAVACTLQALAFFVRDHSEPGRMAFDGVGIELRVMAHDAQGNEVPADVTGEIPPGLVPIDRTVYARNTGAQQAWVRVGLGFIMEVQSERFDIADLTRFNVNEADWVQRGEWLYLTTPLDPGEVSPPLITGLMVDSQQAIARHGEGTYRFTARAGAVQSKHNATSVLEVEGWPE